ncbi:MAG: hypothetical protein Q4F83_12795 [Eubacteriales bacterium]|nr:hypothetical protein [Eubacteriales bacterium]
MSIEGVYRGIKVLAWAAVGSLIATTVVCEVPMVAAAFEFSSVGISGYVLAIQNRNWANSGKMSGF